jgi:hypothetical protein
MTTTPRSPAAPNPRRVLAGRRNRALRKGLTPQGRERLRLAALQHQPWRFSTGPRGDEGKARAAQNGRWRQQGPVSLRQVRAGLAELRGLLEEMRSCRALAAGARTGQV